MNTAHPCGEMLSPNGLDPRSQAAPAPADWTPRYGLYFTTPRDAVWTGKWSAWLGRCVYTGQGLQQTVPEGVTPADMARLTAEPARYGLHATLKAPFHLVPGLGIAELERHLLRFCEAQQGFVLPPIDAVLLDDFLALRLSVPHAPVERIAAGCVRQFERFRAPLTDRELARRSGKSLSPGQHALMERWGYPYVFNEYRFHFSLTGSLAGVSAATCMALMRAANLGLARLARHPLRFDAISVVEQLHPDGPFCVRLRAPLS